MVYANVQSCVMSALNFTASLPHLPLACQIVSLLSLRAWGWVVRSPNFELNFGFSLDGKKAGMSLSATYKGPEPTPPATAIPDPNHFEMTLTGCPLRGSA